MSNYSYLDNSNNLKSSLYLAGIDETGKSGNCYDTEGLGPVSCSYLLGKTPITTEVNQQLTFPTQSTFDCGGDFCCISGSTEGSQILVSAGSNKVKCNKSDLKYSCNDDKGCLPTGNGAYVSQSACEDKCKKYGKCNDYSLKEIYSDSNDQETLKTYYTQDQYDTFTSNSENPCDFTGKQIKITSQEMSMSFNQKYTNSISPEICDLVQRNSQGCNDVDRGLNIYNPLNNDSDYPLKNNDYCSIGSIDPVPNGLDVVAYDVPTKYGWPPENQMCYNSNKKIVQPGSTSTDLTDATYCSMSFGLTPQNNKACDRVSGGYINDTTQFNLTGNVLQVYTGVKNTGECQEYSNITNGSGGYAYSDPNIKDPNGNSGSGNCYIMRNSVLFRQKPTEKNKAQDYATYRYRESYTLPPV